MSTVCEVNVVPRHRPGRFIGLACGEPATVRIEYGCVHEHIKAEDVCAEHAESVIGAAASMACTSCWEAGHPCPVIGRAAIHGGAA